MPVSDPLLDPRYAELTSELRDARTPTPETLEARLQELLARTPVPAPRVRRRLVRMPPRRLVLGLAGGCAVLALGLLVARMPSPTTSDSDFSASPAARRRPPRPARRRPPRPPIPPRLPPRRCRRAEARPANRAPDDGAPDVPAAGDAARLQHQTAKLTIALKSSNDVSDATGEVTRAIATYGGHIVTVQFATPEGTEARSEIVAKVPIERMQEATDRFTALGRLAGAQVDISDLQERADSLEQRVAAARLQIATFDARLAAPDLTKLQRATLVERRARARQRLADLNADVSATKQEAALADLTVILETDDQAVVIPKSGSDAGDRAKRRPEPSGRHRRGRPLRHDRGSPGATADRRRDRREAAPAAPPRPPPPGDRLTLGASRVPSSARFAPTARVFLQRDRSVRIGRRKCSGVRPQNSAFPGSDPAHGRRTRSRGRRFRTTRRP